jgi:hypothetical protein
MRISHAVAALAVVTGGLVVLAESAQARPQRQAASVRVCSLYGKGCISAPVRPGQFDYEVRLPGGTWISCARDCKQTLREQTVDFFETLRERAPDNRR